LPDRHLGSAVGGGHGIEEIASFMVNDEACAEMRQNDRAGPVCEGMRGRQKGVKGRILQTSHGMRLAALLLCESRPPAGEEGEKIAKS
jgi:hypothetical protein